MTGVTKRLLRWVLQIRTLLTLAALLTLVGLALMVWSLIEPTPMPVILAMSIGQSFGILAFVMFGIAVLLDQMRKQRDKALAAAAAAEAAAPPREAPP